MKLNEKNFLSYLNNLNCFENKPHVAVGVSGGPDSMALVFLLSKWVELKKGKLYALIFDHNIRSDSEQESYKVKNMLKDLKINTHIIKSKKFKSFKKNMSEARTNRFEGLINFCSKQNILHLFLGHHFDDNLETYLIRKINGSNLEGLGCMKNISYFKNMQILRPFIKTSKSSILNFNKKNQVEFINDPSNNDMNYTRVKVRDFLQNKNYKKLINVDFLYLMTQIPNYKKMVWELLFQSLIEVKSKKIKVNLDKLINLDNLIIEKHTLLLLNFLLNKKYQTKSSKIQIFIDSIKKPNFKIFNLNGIIIEKYSNFLIFSQK